MPIDSIDVIEPHRDPRWAALVESHPQSSVFHTPAWLEALRRTYDYKPIAFVAASQRGVPHAGLVFCRVESWLTGRRLVSLPFSDHCEPLADDLAEFNVLLAEAGRAASGLRYLEIRPRSDRLGIPGGLTPSLNCFLHTLDLTPSVDTLYTAMHKDSIQRKIRRADREGVTLDRGRSERHLQDFYTLLLLTRRRHGLPPQPLAWFRNLIDCFGESLTIHVAYADERPIASILTLRHKATLVYKYGCSDERHHPLGAMPRLFWEAIQDAKANQIMELDLGRTERDHQGLIQFKERLGARRRTATYWRQTPGSSRTDPGGPGIFRSPRVGRALSALPDRLYQLTGEYLYRHAG